MGGFSPSYVHSEYGACTGILQILPQMVSPLYAESVSVLAYTPGGKAMPAGGELKLQIYYLTEDGNLGDLIAESTTNEFIKTSGNQGVFTFTFEYEEDGFIVPKPLILGTQAPIAVVLSGFDSTWDFNVLFGVNGGIPGSSYTLHGDHVATFGFSNAPDTPRADVYIQFNGMFNCLSLYDESTTVKFPAEGGWGITANIDGVDYNDIDLYSSFNFDDNMDDVWIESAPDWVVSYDYDDSYFADYNVIALFFKADALPAGVTGRSGNIVISSYGVSASIPVTQGDYTGLPSIKIKPTIATRDGDNFILSYPASATSVAVYNVAGQKMNEYPLNTNGTFTLPASNWAHGAYVLKFGGSNVVVKILK